jgi:hypothetical protein
MKRGMPGGQILDIGYWMLEGRERGILDARCWMLDGREGGDAGCSILDAGLEEDS